MSVASGEGWRPAVLQYPDRELEHVVAVDDGVVPALLELPALDGTGSIDRFLLAGDDGSIAVYILLERVRRQV